MTKIAIYGVGLIGGSLALCFKGKPGLTVVGHSGNPSSVEKYLKREVVDYATTSFEEAAEGADFIFLCVPVGNLEEYLTRLSKLPLKPGCVITDVGSTKASVAEYASRLNLQGVSFIGGHPMAGKEKSGVEAATSRLFENAFYVLTPDKDTPEEAYTRLTDLLQWTRAHIVKVDARLHDEIVGAISHLPHIIAVALVNQVARYNESNELYQNLAAGGFRDITRIASSDPIIWRDILISNKTVMLNLLKDWNEEVGRFIKLLETGNGEGIEQEFHKANQFRGGLPERRKGVIHSFYDIYVDVPDHPGVIGQITMLLGSHRVNLSNIQIIESREDVPGVLRLSFREEYDMDKALELLKKDYTVHV
ncbi:MULTISPECIES: prephenate dehydrogenase [Paenibacillus]|uniref:Prephenate dehydrogenase n=1 Tax=Paenibacillus naphthalenovorans TaxID=162209 RepID=A0A0U2W285_9BACL|nr:MULTISPECIES: prephenate dehydrogenase [Paenibacillus]ALS22660.1 prephenate dehydrogenase [Paenibacillus naphthalenovorans]